jgi:3-hydroxyacyl-[acyl-carrier-protein] dehydratase
MQEEKIKNGNGELSFLLSREFVETLSVDKIMATIPHRYPFLLVDRVDVVEKGKYAVGAKCVSINEHFFQGHFPQKPVMPAVLILESMAQTCAAMMLSQPEYANKLAFFMGISDAKFRRPVVPGDVLKICVDVIRSGSRAGKIKAQAFVGNQCCGEATLSFAIVDK